MTDRFSGTSPDPVQRGSDLTVRFKNPDLAGTTVTVPIVDDEGNTASVNVKLDSTGEGTTKWTVPSGWGDFATLQHPTSSDHTVAVTGVDGAAKKRTKKNAPRRR